MAKSPADFPRGWDHSKGLPPGWSPWDQIAQHYGDQEQLEKDYPGITAPGGVYGHVVMTPNGPAVPTPEWMLANQRTADGLAKLKAMGKNAPLNQKELHAQHLNANQMLDLAKQARGQQPDVRVTVGQPEIAKQLSVQVGKPVMPPQVSIGTPQIEQSVSGLTIPVPAKAAPAAMPAGAGYAMPTPAAKTDGPAQARPQTDYRLKDVYALYAEPTE